VLADLRTRLSVIKDAYVLTIPPPPVQGLGSAGGFKMMLKDRAGLGPEALVKAASTLVAQYESWKLPLAIVLILPMCLLASVTGLLARGLPIDILSQIGFVVLVGLAAKNAILIVEFARSPPRLG
jgi:multidrug efflux pump subunit AcrB